MKKSEAIDIVASKTGITRLEARYVVDGLMVTIAEALARGEDVSFSGFGTFRVRHRAARMARNPSTNEPVEVAARNVPVFKPSANLRALVNRGTEENS